MNVKAVRWSVVVALTIVPAALDGQSAATAPVHSAPVSKKKWIAPKTPWGHPDFQGVWNNATTTPLQRPSDVNKPVLSDEELARLTKEVARALNTDNPPQAGDTGTYNEVWWERGNPLKQTALVVDPEDGRVPPLSPEGRKRVLANAEAIAGRGEFDSWLDRPLTDRCLLQHGVPPLPTGYNNNYQILQTPDYVAIRQETLAEVRIIPLDGRPHLGQSISTWMGDPRGRWEGTTLVVENTNFNGWGGGLYAFYGTSRMSVRGTVFPLKETMLKVVERFTRVDETTIDYRATIEDVAMFTRSWSIALPLRKVDASIYEYACHEGNFAMEHMLSGARVQERTKKKRSN
jgi:hypothetical protein